jgi:hypothetical protein
MMIQRHTGFTVGGNSLTVSRPMTMQPKAINRLMKKPSGLNTMALSHNMNTCPYSSMPKRHIARKPSGSNESTKGVEFR